MFSLDISGWSIVARTVIVYLALLAGLRFALDLSRRKLIDALCFAPIHRASLRAAGMPQEDVLQWTAEIFDRPRLACATSRCDVPHRYSRPVRAAQVAS